MRLRFLALSIISALTMTACASSNSPSSNLSASTASEPQNVQQIPLTKLQPAVKVDPTTQAPRTGLVDRADVQAFIKKTSQEQGLDPKWMTDVLNHTKLQP